jgi:hypothetical protein
MDNHKTRSSSLHKQLDKNLTNGRSMSGTSGTNIPIHLENQT